MDPITEDQMQRFAKGLLIAIVGFTAAVVSVGALVSMIMH